MDKTKLSGLLKTGNYLIEQWQKPQAIFVRNEVINESYFTDTKPF